MATESVAGKPDSGITIFGAKLMAIFLYRVLINIDPRSDLESIAQGENL